MRSVTLAYAGVDEEQDHIVHPEATLHSPGEVVSITPVAAGGPAPTGGVEMYLDGKLAGYGNVGISDTGTYYQYFQANPGTYVLTAHYNGDANYAPADLTATVVTVPAAPATGLEPGMTVTAIGEPSAVATGSALAVSLAVGVTNPFSTAARIAVTVGVYATMASDPSVETLLQTVEGAVKVGRGKTAEARVKLDYDPVSLALGDYQLVYHATDGSGGSFAYIYDPNVLAVENPAVSFSAAVVKLPHVRKTLAVGSGFRGQAVLEITDTGNTAFAGEATFTTSLSQSPGTAGVAFASSPAARPLKLAAGQSTQVRLNLSRVPAVVVGSDEYLTVVVTAAGNLDVAPALAFSDAPLDILAAT